MIKRVVVLKDKTPLINRIYEPGASQSSATDLGGFQSVVDAVYQRLAVVNMGEEIINNSKITFSKNGDITFITSSDRDEVGVLEIFQPELESLFFAVFPQDFIDNWQGDDVSVFKGFEPKLDQMRSAFENRITTKPGSRRVLDTLSIMELPQRLQSTATKILDAKTASFEEVIRLTGLTPQEAVNHIQEILNAGFLYTTKVGNRVFYSVKSFSEAQSAPEQTKQVAPTAPTTTTTTTGATQKPVTPAIASETVKSEAVSELAPGVELMKRDVNKGNMPFLIRTFKKNLDRVFNAILNRKVVLVIINPETDKNQVLLNMILDTLQCFAPERELRIATLAKDFIHPRDADIIRLERGLLQFYSNEIVMDLDKKRISNGENDPYLEELVKDMSKMKHNECVSLLINRVNLIEKLARDFAKIKKLNLPSDDFIANIRAKHNPLILPVMENVAENIYMD